jgi:hypothetical protein
MPLAKKIEKRIWDIEGFDVNILHEDRRNLRADKSDLPQYPYQNAAKNDWTVEAWKAQRFRPNYPGYDVEVLNGTNDPVPGNTKLGNVRDTYSDE